jgi:hypothetical protein
LIKKFDVLSVMIFGPIIPSFGLLFMGFSYGKAGIFVFITGIIFCYAARSIGSIARMTVQQIILPSHIRGEISGVMMMITWGMIPIPIKLRILVFVHRQKHGILSNEHSTLERIFSWKNK